MLHLLSFFGFRMIYDLQVQRGMQLSGIRIDGGYMGHHHDGRSNPSRANHLGAASHHFRSPDKQQVPDFLSENTRVTAVQLIGLIILGINCFAISLFFGMLIVAKFTEAIDAPAILLVVFGSIFCMFFAYLGYRHIKRALIGRLKP
jgi:hypothetical protein